MLFCATISAGMLAVMLVIGTLILVAAERFSLVDAFLNAVLIMTGLGLVNTVGTTTGKLLVAFYSLVSALTFYSALVVFFSPILHRLLHHFHLDWDNRPD